MNLPNFYSIEKTDSHSQARAGILNTAHGRVLTPTFMAVGTQGAVKAVGPDDLKAVGSQIILSNTYHLYLRPGPEIIRLFGGLHRFMGWSGPILTDSGGYQVFSLSAIRKLTPEGVTFKSPYDGSQAFISPEKAVEIQNALGVDIMMCLDECTPYPATLAETEKSLNLTLDWARRCRETWDPGSGQALFGIVQGGFYPELRARAAEEIASLDFPGHALGGLALGEPAQERLLAVETARGKLPAEKPLYLMGLGTPEDLIQGVLRGADLFDCVIPTRNARNGQLITRRGRLNILNSRYKTDQNPPDPDCGCLACRSFSRSYLRHLHQNRDPLYLRLASVHNLYYYLELLAGLRQAILSGKTENYVRTFYAQNKTEID
ncbi:MAG: tRNA guanosine(34) transglycosylase Tgt [Deltaproteobacteria bacterium]|nr:tRNA guanosine(34) transglycosylase Tgt [Deltaproteobacteria bacterium]